VQECVYEISQACVVWWVVFAVSGNGACRDYHQAPGGKSMVTSPTVSGAANRQNPGDTLLRQYDLDTGRVIREFPGHSWAGTSLAVNTTGSRLVSCIDKSARLWDLRDGKLLSSLSVGTGGRSLAVNREGTMVAVSEYKDGLVQLWDVSGNRRLAMLAGSTEDTRLVEPEKLGFSDDGRLVFGYSRLYNQSVQDKTEMSLPSKMVHDETAFIRVSAAALLPGGLGVVLSTSGGNNLWGHILNMVDFQVPELVSPMHPSLDIYSSLVADPNNRYVLAWDYEPGGVALWNLETGRLDGHLPRVPGQHVGSSAISGDRQYMYLSVTNGIIKWDVAKRRIVDTWKIDMTPAKMVAVGNDLLCYSYVAQQYTSGGEYVVFRLDGRNGSVSVRELRRYVEAEVPRLSESIMPGAFQHPVVDRDNLYLDFGF